MKIYQFKFKKTRSRNAIPFEYTGTWAEFEMYYPGALIISCVLIPEEELEYA